MKNTLDFFCRKLKCVKVNSFFEIIISEMTPRHFRKYLRMKWDTFNRLCRYISDIREKDNYHEVSRITLDKQVAMTLCYLGSRYTILS